MKKIEGLYRSYCHERELEMQEYHTGGNRMKDLQEFLKSKLNGDYEKKSVNKILL